MRNPVNQMFFAVFVASLVALVGGAAKADFPGKGSYNVWHDATEIYNEGVHDDERGVSVDAIEKYKTAIKAYPYDARYYGNLSWDYALLNKLELAEFNARKAAELEPEVQKYKLSLAKIIAARGRTQEAIALANRIRPDRDDVDLQKRLAKFKLDMRLLSKGMRTGN